MKQNPEVNNYPTKTTDQQSSESANFTDVICDHQKSSWLLDKTQNSSAIERG